MFLALVVLSAVVAVFALIDGNIALLIGAMVLTPLLGPNLALAFSTATGDFQLMKRAVLCGLAGFGATFVTASVLGYFLGRPAAQNMQEMLTEYGFESIPIAVCAGTAATLYMLKGTQSPLIGVMVAIAFLPPIAMTGLAMVTGQGEKSIEAFMLFAINLVCFNLAANTVLLVAGLRPRFDKDNSFRGPMLVSLLAWCTAVSILASILLFGR